VATGTTLRRVTLPPGLAGSGIAGDPPATTLYVSAAHVAPHGGARGPGMFAYHAPSRRPVGRGPPGAAALSHARRGGALGARGRLGFVPDRNDGPDPAPQPGRPADDHPARAAHHAVARHRDLPLAHV